MNTLIHKSQKTFPGFLMILILFSGIIFCHFEANSQSFGLDDSLVAHYPFNGNALDVSGNNHHGTVHGALITYDRFNRPDSAYFFDGIDDYIDCGDPPDNSFDLINEFTIAAWISLSSSTESDGKNVFHSVVAKDEGPGPNVRKWIFGLVNTKLAFHINGPGYGGGFWVYSQTQDLRINQWYHVVITRTGNLYTFFLDGRNAGTAFLGMSIYDVNESLTIGYSEPVGPFHGSIEEVRIYNRVLSDHEIFEAYNWEAQLLDVKVYLEGPFNGTDMETNLNSNGYLPLVQPYNQPPWNYDGPEKLIAVPNNEVVDWVLIEFRDTTQADRATPEAIDFLRAGLLLNDGHVVDLDGTSPLAFNTAIDWNLFLVVRHRNHLDIQATYIANYAGGMYSYDFTIGMVYVWGGLLGHKELAPNKWGMMGGDGLPDGQVSNTDKIDVWGVEAGSSGYFGGDFNMDGQVNNLDKVEIWIPNTGQSSQVIQ